MQVAAEPRGGGEVTRRFAPVATPFTYQPTLANWLRNSHPLPTEKLKHPTRNPAPPGLPVAVKDVTAVKGVRYTAGSRLFEARVADEDDPLVQVRVPRCSCRVPGYVPAQGCACRVGWRARRRAGAPSRAPEPTLGPSGWARAGRARALRGQRVLGW